MPDITINMTPEQLTALLELAENLRAFFAKRGASQPRRREKHVWDLTHDPWVDALAEADRSAVQVSTRGIAEVLGLPLPIPPHQARRIAAVMRHLGWTGPTTLNINGKQVRGYKRP